MKSLTFFVDDKGTMGMKQENVDTLEALGMARWMTLAIEAQVQQQINQGTEAPSK